MVAAVRKEVIEDYSELLSRCGLNPLYTVGALTASSLCPPMLGPCAVLDIGKCQSALICFESTPTSVRTLPWGGEEITRTLQETLQLSRDQAEQIKLDPSSSRSARSSAFQTALDSAVASLASSLKTNWTGPRLYLLGRTTLLPGFTTTLAEALGKSVACETIEVPSEKGLSAAILGLQKSCGKNGQLPPLLLQIQAAPQRAEGLRKPALSKWAALALLLALGSLSLRYAEAILKKPNLSQRLSEIRAAKEALPKIDRELSFHQYLATNQPPYLDLLDILARAAPKGTLFSSLSLHRRGELSLKGTLQDSKQATELRSKLIDSGWFTTVILEEQTPINNQKKVIVRISARWKFPNPPAPAQPKKG